MNEIKGHRKCMVVLKFLENIEGAVASPPLAPSKLCLWVQDAYLHYSRKYVTGFILFVLRDQKYRVKTNNINDSAKISCFS